MYTVKTNYGEIAGIRKNGYRLYKGVPYAKAPVGELRFRAPVEPEPWEGVLEANRFSKRCYQFVQAPKDIPGYEDGDTFYGNEFYSDMDYMPEMSEDCLYMNLWVPDHEEGERMPVAFYIHGGAYRNGFSSEIEFDGAGFARKKVILITFNYRLGIFGFLAHPWLAAEDPEGHCGNYGLLDQIAALKWVKENITAFGGDPDNITVFGQSAGCGAAQVLISSDLSKDLVAKAVLHSSSSYNTGSNRILDIREAMACGEELIRDAGIGSLEELRALSGEEVLIAAGKWKVKMASQGKSDIMPFIPILDHYVINAQGDASLETGEIARIPYMIGSVKNDFGFTKAEELEGKRSLLYYGTQNWAKKLSEMEYPAGYVYCFERDMPGDEAGAFHSSELWYLFGTLDRCWRPVTDEDYALSEKVLSYWTNFMKTGNPNGEGLEKWEECTAEAPVVMALNI